MMVAADMAKFFEQEKEKGRNLQLKMWIDDNPDNLAVLVTATALATIEDISEAPVRLPETIVLDLMKLGTGFAEGTKLGIAEDILRLLSVIPEGKIVQGASGLRPFLGGIVQRLSNLRYFRTLRGKSCAPISIAQALIRTGQRFVVKLEDVARAMERTVDSFIDHGASSDEVRAALGKLKANFAELPAGSASTFDDVKLFAEGTDGVMLVALKRSRAGVDGRHLVVVGKTRNGVKIFDRKGVFDNLEALSRAYGSKSASEFYQVNIKRPLFSVLNWTIDPELVHLLNKLGMLGAVVVRASMILGFDVKKSIGQLKAEFDAFARDRNAGPLPPPPGPPSQSGPPNPRKDIFDKVYIPGAGTMLSNLAKKYYQGRYDMWPLIWAANFELIGENPNRVPADIYLDILTPGSYSAAQIAEAKRVSPNWNAPQAHIGWARSTNAALARRA